MFLFEKSFMDSQINKVHSPNVFCIVLSDLMGFWDALISTSDHTHRLIQYKKTMHATSKTAHGRVPPELSRISPTSNGHLPPTLGDLKSQ